MPFDKTLAKSTKTANSANLAEQITSAQYDWMKGKKHSRADQRYIFGGIRVGTDFWFAPQLP